MNGERVKGYTVNGGRVKGKMVKLRFDYGTAGVG